MAWNIRDIAYIVFTIVQIGGSICLCCWTDRKNKKKDSKHEKDRREKEERHNKERIEMEEKRMEREDRDTIAEISSEYDKIENQRINLQKCKKKFGTMIIFSDSSCEITGLDVLKYMCHPDNYPNHENKMLSKLHSDLEAVVRLFQSFRIKLPPDGICPDNIREQLGPQLIELGDITASFVSGTNYYTISKVLKYFGRNMEPATSFEPATSPIEQQQQIDAAKNEEVKSKIPYIGVLCFGDEDMQQMFPETADINYHDTYFTLKCKQVQGNKEKQIISDLEELAFHLRTKETICNTDDLEEFGDTIEKIWSKNEQLKDIIPDYSVQDKLRVNILHAVCVFSFLVTGGGGIIHDQQFKLLVKEMLKITKVQDSELQNDRCRKVIERIQWKLNNLLTSRSYLCKQKTIADKLENINEDLSTFIREQTQQNNTGKIAGNFPGGSSKGDVIHTTQP